MMLLLVVYWDAQAVHCSVMNSSTRISHLRSWPAGVQTLRGGTPLLRRENLVTASGREHAPHLPRNRCAGNQGPLLVPVACNAGTTPSLREAQGGAPHVGVHPEGDARQVCQGRRAPSCGQVRLAAGGSEHATASTNS